MRKITYCTYKYTIDMFFVIILCSKIHDEILHNQYSSTVVTAMSVLSRDIPPFFIVSGWLSR